MNKPDVIGEVINERKRQDEKWAEQNHDPLRYLAILGEEYGEACKAVVEWEWAASDWGKIRSMRLADLREELIQTAAVAIAFVECLDRGKWKETPDA